MSPYRPLYAVKNTILGPCKPHQVHQTHLARFVGLSERKRVYDVWAESREDCLAVFTQPRPIAEFGLGEADRRKADTQRST